MTSLNHLSTLRAVVPPRPLTIGEGFHVAELQANRLLEGAGIREPGTPSEVITEQSYMHVVLRPDLPVSGSAQWLKPRWLLLLNANEPATRRRFSLFHEYKHVLDHVGIDYLYPARTAPERYRRAERVADHFAACALMPKRLVVRLWGQGVQDTSELAERFEVSEVAMRFRLQTLGLTDAPARCSRPLVPATRFRYFRPLSLNAPSAA